MATRPLPKISIEEYLERERSASFRSEYISGQMYAMAGASLRHNRINRNVLTTLTQTLVGCEALSSDQRVYSPKHPFFAYPDTFVYCGEPELMADQVRDTLLNPILIVEVLSDSTREYDLGLKFEMYKDIPSFREYLTIEQDMVGVRHLVANESGVWENRDVRALGGVIRFASLAGEISLSDVYRGLDFDSTF